MRMTTAMPTLRGRSPALIGPGVKKIRAEAPAPTNVHPLVIESIVALLDLVPVTPIFRPAVLVPAKPVATPAVEIPVTSPPQTVNKIENPPAEALPPVALLATIKPVVMPRVTFLNRLSAWVSRIWHAVKSF